MAKIGTQTKRLKANFLFPLLCAGFVPEDDLIWNQEIYLFNHCARFSLQCLFIQKYVFVFHVPPFPFDISEGRKDESFNPEVSFSPAMSFLIVYVDWEDLLCYSLQTPRNPALVWGGLHLPGENWWAQGLSNLQLFNPHVQTSLQNYQQGYSSFFLYIQNVIYIYYLHLIFLLLNTGSIYLMPDL